MMLGVRVNRLLFRNGFAPAALAGRNIVANFFVAAIAPPRSFGVGLFVFLFFDFFRAPIALESGMRGHGGFCFRFFVGTEQAAERYGLLIGVNLDVCWARRSFIDERLWFRECGQRNLALRRRWRDFRYRRRSFFHGLCRCESRVSDARANERRLHHRNQWIGWNERLFENSVGAGTLCFLLIQWIERAH